LDELKQHTHGVSIPLKVDHKKYERYDSETQAYLGFKTPSKRLEIFSQTFKNHGYEPLPTYQEPAVGHFSRPELRRRYPLILTCNKLLHFCHGQHRAIPSLRKAVPYPFIEINSAMARKLEIKNGEWVSVETPHGKIRCQAHLTEGIAYDVVSIQHGWWQPCPQLGLPGYDPYSSRGANANLLYTTDEIDPISGSVPYKAYICKLTNLRETSRERSRGK
jgi:anaerobic selenocysteine-containing dehydrogenase